MTKALNGSDVAKMRGHLAELEAELAGIELGVVELSERRDRLAAERSLTKDVVRSWKIEEELSSIDGEIRVLLDKKLLPAERVAQLRTLLTPVIEREREAEHRAAAAAGCEKLLQLNALLEAGAELLVDARRFSSQSAGRLSFDSAMTKVENLIARWREQTAPQLREAQSDHRRFIQAVEAQR